MMVETITCNYPVWCKVNSAFLGPFQQVGLAGDIAEGQLNILALSQNTNERKKKTFMQINTNMMIQMEALNKY